MFLSCKHFTLELVVHCESGRTKAETDERIQSSRCGIEATTVRDRLAVTDCKVKGEKFCKRTYATSELGIMKVSLFMWWGGPSNPSPLQEQETETKFSNQAREERERAHISFNDASIV